MTTSPSAAVIGLNRDAEAIARDVFSEAGYTVVMLGAGPDTFDLLAGDGYAVVVWAMPDTDFPGTHWLRLIRLLGLSTAIITVDRDRDSSWQQRHLGAGAQAALSLPLQPTALRDAITNIMETPAHWVGVPLTMAQPDSTAVIDPRTITGVPQRTVFRIARSMVEATEKLIAEAQLAAWPRVAVMARVLRATAESVGAHPLITTSSLLAALDQQPYAKAQAQWPMLQWTLQTTLDQTLDALWLIQRQSGNWLTRRDHE